MALQVPVFFNVPVFLLLGAHGELVVALAKSVFSENHQETKQDGNSHGQNKPFHSPTRRPNPAIVARRGGIDVGSSAGSGRRSPGKETPGLLGSFAVVYGVIAERIGAPIKGQTEIEGRIILQLPLFLDQKGFALSSFAAGSAGDGIGIIVIGRIRVLWRVQWIGTRAGVCLLGHL